MRTQIVTARQNPLVKKIYALKDKKKRDEAALFVTEGRKPLEEGLQNGCVPVYLLVREDIDISDALIRRLDCVARNSCECVILGDSAFKKISSDKASEGILCVWNFLSGREEMLLQSIRKNPTGSYLILERVQDPGNIGTILRSALAFGCDGVLLCDCADIYNPKTVRATMGNLFRVPFAKVDRIESCRELLPDGKLYAAMVSSGGITPEELQKEDKAAVLIGNEGQGLSKQAVEICDGTVHIPIRNAESLNAAVAASVLLWEMSKGRAL